MSKVNYIALRKKAAIYLRKHSSEILQGIGITGMITTTVIAVKATPKAVCLIHEDSRNNHDGDPYAYTNKEAVVSAWRCYIPAVVVGGASVACLIGASSTNRKRNAALVTAYTLSESAFNEYREKIVETIGEKKEQSVRDEIDKKRIEETKIIKSDVIVTGKGMTLCLDPTSQRTFYSDIDKIRKAENELNRRMRDENYITLNEFYNEIGLGETTIGNDMGWDISRGYIDLRFSSQLTDNDEPCLVVGHNLPPIYFG